MAYRAGQPQLPRIDRGLGKTEGFIGGRLYTVEEMEFLRAVEDYRQRHRRRFLALTEYLEVLKSLGYRKAE